MVITISSALQSLSHVTRGQGMINSHIIRMRACHHHPGVGYIAHADARKKHTYTFSKCNTCMLVGGPRIYHDKGRCSQAGLSLASLLIIMLRTHPHCTLGGKRNLPRGAMFTVCTCKSKYDTCRLPLGRCLTAYSNSAENKGTCCPGE